MPSGMGKTVTHCSLHEGKGYHQGRARLSLIVASMKVRDAPYNALCLVLKCFHVVFGIKSSSMFFFRHIHWLLPN